MIKNLGDTLKECRSLAGLTLREVQEVTNVSNAYLSQLENGKIKKPSANVLYKLAGVYKVSLDLLLAAAGIIKEGTGVEKTYNVLPELTPDEEQKLLEYLRFLRSGKKTDG